VRGGDRGELEQRRAEARSSEQDRDGADARRVEPEHEQREDEPGGADDEEDPPEVGPLTAVRLEGGHSRDRAGFDVHAARLPPRAGRLVIRCARFPSDPPFIPGG